MKSSLLLVFIVRILCASACVSAVWSSVKMARADFLFRQDTASSLRKAIHLEPDAWKYDMRLAQLDESHAPELLETALHLNPFDAQADIELGLRAEAEGDMGKAERLLLQAFAVDDTYVPRWSLAGFYLRRGNINAFWTWARKAVEMPAQDIGSLFELCWRVSASPEEIKEKILDANPERIQPDVIRQYLNFLLHKGQLAGAEGIAQRLTQTGKPSVDRPVLFAVINQMLITNKATAAATLWRSLNKQRWVDGEDTVPYNGRFSRDPLPIGFDWTLPSYTGLHSWPERSGLETEFTGVEPEDCLIAQQAMVLPPGNYKMEYTYRTAGIPPDTGIRWQIVDSSSGLVLSNSPYLSSETQQQAELFFAVGQDSTFLRLRLIYKRVLGTSRVAGTLITTSTQVKPRSYL